MASLLDKFKTILGPGDDPQFTVQKKAFEDSKKSLDKVAEHLTGYLEQALLLLKAQMKVAEDMGTGDPKALPEGMVKDNIALVEKMLLEKNRVDEEIRRGFQDPLNKYKAQYRELEERMRERTRRQEEVVKLTSDVKKYKEKNDPRLPGTEKRLTSAQQAFEDLHQELMEDIPKLVADKILFFDPLVAVLIDAQIHFYQGMYEKLAEIQSRITHIDRTTASTHPRVIRPRQESAVGRSYSSFTSPSHGGVAAAPFTPAQAASPYATQQPQMTGGPPPAVPHRALPLPGAPAQPRARGVWDFATVQPGELPFAAGDVLNIIDASSGDWWTAELNGRQGLIPANYVQMI